MVYDTFEQGPIINTLAPDFTLPDHSRKLYGLKDLIGDQGMLLGFIGDIWQPASVRRILWLQRHVSKFALMGTPVALLVRDHAHTLYGFHTSSPLPVPFPLLSDVDGAVHQLYQMDKHAGLVMVDHQRTIRQKWLMSPEYVWPKLTELVQAAQLLHL